MPSLIFYRQRRVDGGVRTGVELDNETIAEEFEDGDGDRDPALLWYVDLRCEGEGLPGDPAGSLEWLLDQEGVIVQGFREYARECEIGVDPDDYPRQWSRFTGAPPGVMMEIASSSLRRITARQIADEVKEIGENWSERIRQLVHSSNVAH